MEHIAFVLEIFSIMVCLHKEGRRRLRYNVGTAVTVLVMLIWVEMINYYKIPAIFSLINYVILFIYTKAVFKKTAMAAFIKVFAVICIIAGIQYVYAIPIVAIGLEDQALRIMLINTLVFITCVLISHWHPFEMPAAENLKANRWLWVIFSFLALLFLVVLFQDKILLVIRADIYFLTIPAVAGLIVLMMKWSKERCSLEDMKNEIALTRDTKDDYEDLLESIKLKQHEFKNHITSMLSSHYVCNTYENLVRAQTDHYDFLKEDNKYNDLLLLGDSIITGFIYGKIKEAETDGIEIILDIRAKIEGMTVSKYKVIELIGILMDNAMEELKKSSNKKLYIGAINKKGTYTFVFRNPCEYASFDEIDCWFQMGKSKKGPERGLGLYHARKICEEEDCRIGCKNVVIEENNWIEFSLEIR